VAVEAGVSDGRGKAVGVGIPGEVGIGVGATDGGRVGAGVSATLAVPQADNMTMEIINNKVRPEN